MSEHAASNPAELQADLMRRLRRIEGQVQGIQRMIEEQRDCTEIFNQLKSIHSATYGACLVVLRQYALECLAEEGQRSREQALDDLIALVMRLPS